MNDSDASITPSEIAGIFVALTICGHGEATFHVTLTPDGAGALYDQESCAEPITFTHSLGANVAAILNAADLTAENATTSEGGQLWLDLREEAALAVLPEQVGSAIVEIDDSLTDTFWEDLNEQLGEDAVIADGDIDDEECGFTYGDQETFDRAITLAQACWLRLNPGDSFLTEISTGEDETTEDGTPEDLKPLIKVIADAFGLTGGTYEYNDEDNSRRSGYSYCSRSHSYDTDETRELFSARELIEAPRALITLLEPFGLDPRGEAPDIIGLAETDVAA
jgi:hypothetical protein